jgi:hypothetical protein
MSEPENFIARWSRRKRAAAQEAEAKESSAASGAADEEVRAPEEHGDESDVTMARRSASESAEPAFDVTKLPPIESSTADSDIRAFLAPGVPPELTRAALRRAWAADLTSATSSGSRRMRGTSTRRGRSRASDRWR